MRIALLFLPGCPNIGRLRRRLHEALDETAIVASVTETEVASMEEAVRAGMAGSPTVLIDGRDPFLFDGATGSLACRLYRAADRVDGAPSVAQIIEALTVVPPHAGGP